MTKEEESKTPMQDEEEKNWFNKPLKEGSDETKGGAVQKIISDAKNVSNQLAKNSKAAAYSNVDFSTRAPDPGGVQKGMERNLSMNIKADDPTAKRSTLLGDDNSEYEKQKKKYGL
tara:strand:- start:51 stop:398 length:348 start_codon:yes stop_codon:yes gene_type:complete